jgi:quercetin dioxygenase-like cupin family protein
MLKSEKNLPRVEKPWGYETIWAKTDKYVGKILRIHKNHKLSLQFHRFKEETILIKSGKMNFLFENDAGVIEEIIMSSGDIHHIPAGRKHRMIAIEDCEVVEVSTPELDDVVRLEDGYGRVGA